MQKTAYGFGCLEGTVYKFPIRYRTITKTLLVMKLTVFLMMITLVQVRAESFAQSISFTAKGQPLKDVFIEIKKQTGYLVFGRDALFEKSRPVTASVTNMPLDDFLQLIMKDQPLLYKIESKTILLFPRMSAALPSARPQDQSLFEPVDTITVRGRVVNEKDEPVAGVSVTVKGKPIGTTTLEDGSFVLRNIDGKATLVFSGVNVETMELRLRDKSSLGTIALAMKVAGVQEVIVSANTGYQTLTRERATGAYDVVGKDVLEKRPASDLSTSLQGLVPGLQARENLDGSMNFLIRGSGSIYGSNAPLIVVDGFVISGSDFSTINPNDVESVTVLKDAAAASIWGARAANGVIVVTTKKAKAGREKVTVEANVFTRISKMIDLEQVMNQASSPDHVRYEKLAYDREIWFVEPYFPSFININSPLTLAQEFMFANRYNGYGASNLNASLDSLSKISNRQQLKDHFLRNAILNQATISLSASSGRSRTYGSILYEGKRDGIVNTGYNRYLMNFTNQYDATSFLQFNFGANVQYRKNETTGPTIDEMLQLSPYETLLNPDGTYSVNLNSMNREQLAKMALNKFPYHDWSYNLLREVRNRKITSEQLSVRAQAGLRLKLLKGLDFDARFQYERLKTDNSNYQSEETFYARNMVNEFVEYDDITQETGKRFLPNGGILRTSHTDLESFVIRNQLNLNTNLVKGLSLTAILGNELSSYTTNGKTDPWVYGYFPEKNQSAIPPYGYGSVGNYLSDYRGYSRTILGGNTEFTWNKDKYVSFYGNAALSFRSKYVVSGSARSDASNYITDDPKLRWSPLWSIGGLWRASEEPFVRKVKFIDNLSVRLTYGKNGNAEKSTSTKPLLNIPTIPSTVTGTIIATISDNGNPFLRWERTTTTNFGIDFSIFKQKLFGKIDLYNKLGKDITGNVQLPATTGTTSQRFNNSEIINRGIELDLGTSLEFGKLQWNTNITYAYNYNRVKNLYYPSALVRDLIGLISDPVPVEGRPMGALYSIPYLGMIDSVPYYGTKNRRFAANDYTLYSSQGLGLLDYSGTTIPPHTLGWINSFSACGFDLMIVFIGKFGGVFREPTFNYNSATIGSFKTSVNMFVRDVFNNDPRIPQFPRYQDTESYSWNQPEFISALVSDASFIECKEVNLQYNMPSRIVKGWQLNGLRFFAQVRDLGIVWRANNKGFHPEWLPGTRRPVTAYTFGINAKF